MVDGLPDPSIDSLPFRHGTTRDYRPTARRRALYPPLLMCHRVHGCSGYAGWIGARTAPKVDLQKHRFQRPGRRWHNKTVVYVQAECVRCQGERRLVLGATRKRRGSQRDKSSLFNCQGQGDRCGPARWAVRTPALLQ